jgi:hypothetical protein
MERSRSLGRRPHAGGYFFLAVGFFAAGAFVVGFFAPVLGAGFVAVAMTVLLVPGKSVWHTRAPYSVLGRVSRACRTWGLCRFVPLLDVHVWIPLFEHGGPFSVQGLDAGLQEHVCPPFRPLHLMWPSPQ